MQRIDFPIGSPLRTRKDHGAAAEGKPLNLVNLRAWRVQTAGVAAGFCLVFVIAQRSSRRNTGARSRADHLMPPIRAISRQTVLDSIRFRLCAHYKAITTPRANKEAASSTSLTIRNLSPIADHAEITPAGRSFLLKRQAILSFSLSWRRREDRSSSDVYESSYIYGGILLYPRNVRLTLWPKCIRSHGFSVWRHNSMRGIRAETVQLALSVKSESQRSAQRPIL